MQVVEYVNHFFGRQGKLLPCAIAVNSSTKTHQPGGSPADPET